MTYPKREGDKKNSEYFEEFIPKIYERRKKSGLVDLIKKVQAIVVQVERGDALKYMMELYLMTPYRFTSAYKNETHTVYCLSVNPDQPTYIVLEPNNKDYFDLFSSLNSHYARASEKINARYLGEIFHVSDRDKVQKILTDEQFRFLEKPDNAFLANSNFIFTERSYYTNNIIGYTENDFNDPGTLDLGESIQLDAESVAELKKVDKVHKDLDLDLIKGIDHLATRVLSSDREDAILEFLSLSNYYLWGAFNIDGMNSSTNVTRNPEIKSELHSPAKVFTANNTPFYTKSIDGLPSPTEDFVRNFGRRMHHIAYEVIDGEHAGSGLKNIDYVVGELNKNSIPFLAKIIGECKDFPDLKQIFSKASPYSILITEYVQRCHEFQGFFTKTNVAALTEAAGEDEKLKESGVCD